ncbi:MAG: hypothetical protein KGI25_03725 [Thaumarchaeota archaeon]|nr:hypothetical protein [Nitrososphaerota archaeon]
MSGEVPVGFRFTTNGIDDTISRIKQLHEELNTGTISTREYRSEMREVTTTSKAATQEFNQIKGAVYAANPTLLEFTKTMSGFSAVAQTGLGVTTALNVAILATGQVSNSLQDLKTQLADARLEYERFANSPQFGPASPQAQAALSKYNELLNQYNNESLQVFFQQIQNWITVVSSMVLAVNQGVLLVGMFKTLAGLHPELASIGGAILSWLGPIAIVIAGVEGIYQLLKLLDPQFNQSATDLENAIKEHWNVSDIEASLLAPFVAFVGELAVVGNQIVNFFESLYNGILDVFINPLISAWDDTIGKITGQVSTLPNENIQTLTHDQILQGLGLGSTTTSPGLPQNPIASATNSFLLTGQMKDSVDTQKQTLDTQKISQTILSNMSSTSTMMNDALNSINSSTTLSSQLAQQQLQETQNQKAQIDALKQSIIDNTSKIVELQQQPQTQLVAQHFNPDDGTPIYSQVASDAANQIQTLQSQNAQAAQIIASASSTIGGLDNMTVGLGPVLSSLGLDANTGIGSVISGALGGAAGIGGAGISAGELQQFAQTGDYGIFTAAAIRDGMPKTPTSQDQINAWLSSVNGKGMGTFTAADAAKALNLPGSGSSSGSSNYDPSGMFGGLPGEYGNPIAAASGFEGMVNSPTHFLAGESGPEFVSISPGSKSSGNVIIYNNTTVQGTVLSDYDLNNTIQNSLKQSLKSSGFT